MLIGRNGCGKSTHARSLVVAYARQGCRVLVSDPDGQFAQVVSRSFSSIADYERELRARQGANAPLVVRFTDGVRVPEILDLARRLAAATNYVTPSVVCIDEGTAWQKAVKRQADAELLRATGRRRNDAVGVILLQQQPSMLNFQSMANATEIDIFRLESDYAIRHLLYQLPPQVRLADGRTIPRDSLVAAIPRLGRGQFYAIDKRFHE